MYRLIIIDDEPKIAEGMSQLFPWNNIGFEVVRSFTSAAEALVFLEQNPVDVVLSDIQMPDMTGLELCQRLLGREKAQVVLFSSYQNYEYFRSAIQMGVADYLLKPLTYQALTETFAKLKEKLDESNPSTSEQPVGYYEGLIQQVDEYLRGHLQDATLTRCAKRVALSPSYLSRIYKEYSGKNFVDRLLELRMERACELLDNPDYRAYDVAYDVGYDSPNNFSRAFKAFTGWTPSDYRRRGKEEQK